MRYKVRNILSTSAVALLLGVAFSQDVLALPNAKDNTPGSVVLADDSAKTAPSTAASPKAVESSKNSNVITPSAPILPNNNVKAPLLPSDTKTDTPVLAKTAPLKAPSNNVGNNVPKVSSVVDSSVNPALDPLPALSAEEANALGDNILENFDDNLFSKMSDIEKQSALLSLELRREKIKNEIAAIQAQRKKAEAEELAAAEEREQKKKEWEAKQAQKEFEMRQKENELKIQLEKLRQEKIVKEYKEYKEQMLVDKQKWVENTQKIYQEMAEIEKDRDYLLGDFKRKLNNLRSVAAAIVTEANNAKIRHEKDVDTLKTQISILKARLEAAQKLQKKDNPFAQLPVEKQVLLSDVYAVMEIVGKDDNLVAKLINKNGDTFLVKKGTVLQTGHVINDISETFISATLNGVQDYLFFSAGGILDAEPPSGINSQEASTTVKKNVGQCKVSMTYTYR